MFYFWKLYKLKSLKEYLEWIVLLDPTLVIGSQVLPSWLKLITSRPEEVCLELVIEGIQPAGSHSLDISI